jgi:hypothetical protein
MYELSVRYFNECRMGGQQTSDSQDPDEIDFAVWIMLERGREQGRKGLRERYSGPAPFETYRVWCLVHGRKVLPAGETWHVIDGELDLADTWCPEEGNHEYDVKMYVGRKDVSD